MKILYREHFQFLFFPTLKQLNCSSGMMKKVCVKRRDGPISRQSGVNTQDIVCYLPNLPPSLHPAHKLKKSKWPKKPKPPVPTCQVKAICRDANFYFLLGRDYFCQSSTQEQTGYDQTNSTFSSQDLFIMLNIIGMYVMLRCSICEVISKIPKFKFCFLLIFTARLQPNKNAKMSREGKMHNTQFNFALCSNFFLFSFFHI